LNWVSSPRLEGRQGPAEDPGTARLGKLHGLGVRIAPGVGRLLRAATRWVVALGLLGISVDALGADPAYHAPIAATSPVSSSFGEYRANHFHGGIDFSTSGAVGLPVYAVADGWVWRVRASGSGYGRALYVRLADGRTQVTAHQSRFAPAIAAFVAAAQESLDRYEVDLSPGEGRLPVKRGEIIAWSGESGAGPPHLHFEMREGADANVGVNPRLFGFGDVDTTLPVINRLVVTPVGAGATVEGEPMVRTYPVIRDGRGRYRLAVPVAVAGAVRFGLDVVDPAPRDNRLAPQRIELLEGDLVHYDVRLDRFDWTRAHEVEGFFDLAQADEGRRFVLNLYRPPGATGPEYGTMPIGAGVLEPPQPPAGRSRALTFRATDTAGNAATLAVTLRQSAAAPLLPPPEVGISRGVHARAEVTAAGLVVRLPRGGDSASVVLELPSPPPLWGHFRRRETPSRFAMVALSRSGAALLAPPDRFVRRPVLQHAGGADTLDVIGIPRGGAVRARFGDLTIQLPDSAAFHPFWLGVSIDSVQAVPGFEPVSAAYRLTAPGVALDKAGRFVIARNLDKMARNIGLFRKGDSGWSWVGNEEGDGGTGGNTRYFGTFVLARDASLPSITILEPAVPGGRKSAPPSSRPVLRIRIVDTGSGLAVSTILATLDDVPQLLEWDPEAQVLSGTSRRTLPAGSHRLVVTATDRAGNRSLAERTFTTR